MATTRQVKITINADKVPTDQTDYTVTLARINFPPEMFEDGGDFHANSDGSDLEFFLNSNGTAQIARHIAIFGIDNNPALGKANVKVKFPYLPSSVGLEFYCRYHDPLATEPAADSTYGSQNAYNSKFELAMALEESGNGTTDEFKDGTSNENHGTGGGGNASYTPTRSAGAIEYGQTGDGTNDYIEIPHDSSLNITDEITIAFAVDPDSLVGNFARALSKGMDENRTYNVGNQGGKLTFFYYDDSTSHFIHLWSSDDDLDTFLTSGVMNFVAISLTFGTGSSISVYANGAPVAGSWTIRDGNAPVSATSTDALRLFASYWMGEVTEFWKDRIDEVWLLSAIEDDDWKTTVYNNLSAPGTFASAGTPQDVGAAPSGRIQIL